MLCQSALEGEPIRLVNRKAALLPQHPKADFPWRVWMGQEGLRFMASNSFWSSELNAAHSRRSGRF